MVADFGVIGLALLPLAFFYVATKIGDAYKPFVIFFLSIGVFAAFLTIGTVMTTITDPLNGALAWLNYGILILWLLYIFMELMKVSIIGLGSILDRLRNKGR